MYTGDMRERLLEGFTSGDFVTGNLANSVQRGDVARDGDGYSIPVGSTQVNPPYGLFWEVGHVNAFTGKTERVETWVPMMVQHRDKYVQAVAEEIRAVDGAL